MNIKLFDGDKNREDIYIHNEKLVQVCTDSKDYPSIRFKKIEDGSIINPIFEKTMSLDGLDLTKFIKYKEYEKKINYNKPVFFFCFNFENYYHFIYDTIPYIISYRKLKKSIPNLKLLIPKITFKKFVREVFEILNLTQSDFIEIEENFIYQEFYFSDSFTHGENSNKPPHSLVYELYNEMVRVSKERSNITEIEDKIYISRRTWVNNDLTNIGTNYTTRRKLLNEDELISKLVNFGYKEVFTENLSMVDKIVLFNNAKHIIGAIGGGLCNCLFCNESCNLIAIISPTFLDINYRFLFSLPRKKTLFEDTYHAENTKFKKYQRVLVKEKNIIGEIVNINNDELTINASEILISGWNEDSIYDVLIVSPSECIPLDSGLNSPFYINLEKFIKSTSL